ncbi:peptidoglycan DD-metalloendopeptidase family protein [Anaerobacillus sp. 1_MG-2023]|uniref:peptidoglycan DD-metalloendopeptidase family protein n=1 Tax=Anaerobacillus sp. 1_MG-2023 TaxID=3062655 RepID=UPI0026E15463|nr:peptidoglycan DD-metalloendopeptidase family protein [Anaerobacillus sp. 1_MG-2023]MDO6657378.1 peptidoglycan DD-metalloendopeptidase family protein [Anaerobacillus sp. 1_MG-2023]
MALPKPPDENQGSQLQQIAKDKIKNAAAKKGRKLAKKIAKKGAKLALKVVKHAVAALVKLLISLLGGVSLPVIGIMIGVFVVIVVAFMVSSLMFGTGTGLEGDELDLHEYIVEQSEGTVDMDDPLQRPYRVPEELIAAVIQLDTVKQKDEDEIKELIRKMADELAPEFMYDDFNEWTETKTKVCEDGDCGSWSKVKRKDKWVTKLTSVDYWNGSSTFTHTKKTTDWKSKTKVTYRTDTWTETEEYEVTESFPYVTYENGIRVVRYRDRVVTKTREVEKSKQVKIETTTKTRHQKFDTTENTTEDYSTFDAILNSNGFTLNDKRLVEINYLFADGQMAYIDWLSGMGSGFGNYTGFDGTIIPGNGVPPQYMPYYLESEKKYGVDWFVLAAIHFVETGFSTHETMTSSVGAEGDLQFMKCTWLGWAYPGCTGGLGNATIPNEVKTDPAMIKKYNGYGRDANGDGKADPWDIEDAVATAAYYLSKNGYSLDQRKAVYAYNHAGWYVDKVMKYADKYKAQATYVPSEGNLPPATSGDFMRPATGSITSGYGGRWGKLHAGVDIGGGGRTQAVPIVAAADGVVVRSYLSSSYGNCVIIRHKINGVQYETLYAHMTHRTVANGQTVSKGQMLGNMGSTGHSTGKHLHFEVHQGSWNPSKSASIDPVLVVPF